MGKFKVIVSEKAQKNLLAIEKSGDKGSIKKVNQIILELYEHPENGIGNPEKLKYDLTGFWSRQINRKDRLVYWSQSLVKTMHFSARLSVSKNFITCSPQIKIMLFPSGGKNFILSLPNLCTFSA
ncbi:Txe/YoeB family addiction module toxin [Pedobacter sp. MR2016-19]|uniref:Txe/YoeB family addiction module toxin n=1 Tax=Pedobacter sp. MR2016-19 TaxID=2780089 RepID=UPI001875C552|nr:Txe/YoeB family addiction module toxin [Pedobacter sp. MR2016-19]MBE5319393.1 Txe/YoeB family addiction module toxin [Pedobacter sp. MR2016-19]